MKILLQQVSRTGRVLLLLLSLVCTETYAQDRRITGRISDGGDNSALPGANVVVKGTQTGVVTDADGRFALNVPTNQTVLTISAIGYASQDVTVSNQSEVNVTLSPDIKTLNEVVVTGYGTQAKRDITGAVATVNIKEALKVPITNASQALQGRVCRWVMTTHRAGALWSASGVMAPSMITHPSTSSTAFRPKAPITA